jgi:hypothetical protein
VSKKPATVPDYADLLAQIKDRIRQSQVRAVLSVNAELIRLYWDIGRILEVRQEREGYGKAVIPRLARDLLNEIPEVKGFSERNIGRMIAFSRAYPEPAALLPQAVAKPPSAKDRLRHETAALSIGLSLCQDRSRVVAEYALRGMNKPIGVSEYELTRSLPKELQSSLPSIEAIEAELPEAREGKPVTETKPGTKKGCRL